MSDHTAAMPAEPATIFNALPPSMAQPYLVYVMLCCMGLGILIMEFFNHIMFDIRLLRKPGWTEPSKLLSRIAYFIARYVSILVETLTVCIATLEFDSCAALPRVFGIMGVVMLDGILLIFLQRTMALYSWQRHIVVPLVVLYSIVLVFSAITGVSYSTGTHIPGSRFCTADAKRYLKWTIIRSGLYRAFSMILDMTMFLLTLNRLIDGGLGAIWRMKPSKMYASVNDISLSAFLIRQGLHYYMITVAVDVFYVVTFFGLNNAVYQQLAVPFLASVLPVVAAAAFRDMGRKATSIGKRNALQVNDFTSETDSDRNTAHRSRSARHSVDPNAALNSGVMSAALGRAPTAEKKTRVTWGLKQNNHFTRTRRQPLDLENGVVVTVGTVSRTDKVEQDWDVQHSPQTSSVNLEPETIEMDHKWADSSAVALHAADSNSSTEDVDAKPTKPTVVAPPTL